MRARIAILVSLAGFASPLCAEEIQWRSAPARAEQPAAVGGNSARPVTMARPVPGPAVDQPLDAPADPGEAGVTPVAFKPVPVTRTRGNEVRYAAPLPEGPVIAGTPQGNFAQGSAQGGAAQNGKPAPKDKLEPIEEVPTAPTPLPPDNSGLIVPLDNGMVMGGGDGFGGFPFFLGGVGPRNFVYGSAELLLWNVSRANVTPLLSTGNLNNLNSGILYGNNQLANPGTAGGRFTFGLWLPFFPEVAVEVVGTFLGDNTTTFTANGNLSVPYLNAAAGNQASTLSLTNGSFVATSSSEFWGVEANARLKWYEGPIFWIDFLLGYRNLSLNESLTIYNQSTGVSRLPNLGTVRTLDQFTTTNSFNAVQAGIEMNWNFLNYFTVGGHAKLGLGAVCQTLAINGLNDLGIAGQSGGLHALSSNIGSYRVTEFGVMPDVGVKLGWNPTDRLKLFVGYEFLYLSSVLRAGEQIDPRINPGLLPTQGGPVQPRAPRALLSQNGFWAHGVTMGAIWSW